MATTKSSRHTPPATPANPTAKLEREIAELRKDLAALTKKCAALEGKLGQAGGAVDTSKFVSKHEFSVFKGKVSKKVGLKR